MNSTTGSNRGSQIAIHASRDAVPNTRVPLRLELSYTDDGHTYTQPVNFVITNGAITAVAEPVTRVAVEAASVFPTPACRLVTFSMPRTGSPARLDVVSIDGSILLSRPLDGDLTWDCSSAPAGVYFARLSANGTTAVRRFSVAH